MFEKDVCPCSKAQAKKKVLILDQDDKYKPNYIIEVDENITPEDIEDVIGEMKAKYPGEYNNEDLNEALHDAFGCWLETFDIVCW